MLVRFGPNQSGNQNKVAIGSETGNVGGAKEEEGSKNDLVFEGKATGEILTGTAQGPNGEAWTWTGKRAPALPASVRGASAVGVMSANRGPDDLARSGASAASPVP